MNVYHWFAGLFSKRRKSLSIYKRGMAKAKRHDHRGALDDYTRAIGMSDVPADIKAMALYNRALVYAAMEDYPKGAEDLRAVLGMSEAPDDVKAEATRKLVRMQQRTERREIRTDNHDESEGIGQS